MYLDTHAHLTDGRYESAGEILRSARAAGVDTVITVGYDLDSSERGAEIAKRETGVYFCAGLHPEHAAEADETALARLGALLDDPKAVALGEIGLDYHYEGTDRAAQRAAFGLQLELASAKGLPVAIHARDATEDMLTILKERRALLSRGGIMHCFSGGKEFARECLDLGLSISFSGTVTFRNARKVAEAAAYVPDDRLLAETDSPYLSPDPFRGERNEPARVVLVYRKLAELRGSDPEAIARTVKKNAAALMPRLAFGEE